MSSIPSLERIEFFSGELLTAGDLSSLDSNGEQLRWLHNRTMHNWGIASGLDVHGARGATFVTVTPGFAVDSQGREIILNASVQKPIPAVPGGANGAQATFYLVANYVTDANEAVVEQRSAPPCGVGGAARLSNDPLIGWKTTAQLNSGVDVILGQVSIQNCVLRSAVSGAARRNTTYAPQSAVTAAAVSAQDLQWTAIDKTGKNPGFTTVVDTSAANFTSTPAYTAQIVGTRTLTGPSALIVDFTSISKPSPTAFTLQLALPALSAQINPTRITDPQKGPKLMQQLGWQVCWIAVEA